MEKICPTLPIKWLFGFPPDSNDRNENNLVVKLEINGKVLHGLVCWEELRQAYMFQLGEVAPENHFELYETTVSIDEYTWIRGIIRSELNIYITRGIHCNKCRPMTEQTLPIGFEMSSVR
jgi:hypothetical protein